MKSRLPIIFIIFVLSQVACTKNYELLQGDRQIRFSLPGDIVYDTEYRLTAELGNIHKFNIDYYTDVDSVFYTFYSSVQNGNNGTVELYNFTDSIPIAGSLINVVSNEAGASYQ